MKSRNTLCKFNTDWLLVRNIKFGLPKERMITLQNVYYCCRRIAKTEFYQLKCIVEQ